MDFLSLELNDHLINQIKKKKFTELTPIQEASIPLSLQNKDIIACAKTGSGKTLAFLLPIVQKLFEDKKNSKKENTDKTIKPSALILAPTRELAIQIADEAKYLLKGSPFIVHPVFGGENFDTQKEKLNLETDIIVATPGRLMDYMRSGVISIRDVKKLVLDEADRMLDMGFLEDVKMIVKQTNSERQVSLYSATINYNAIYSIWEYMNEPEEILINPEVVDHSKIKQELFHLARDEKLTFLTRLLKDTDANPVIIFSNTKKFVEILVDHLKKHNLSVEGLSSTIAQKKRLKILTQFKKKQFRILVATDVASRGLDIDNVELIINYDIPQDQEAYVHRIGRTARAGKNGWAISFCSELDYQNLERVEEYLKYKISVSSPKEEYFKKLYYPQNQRTKNSTTVKEKKNYKKKSNTNESQQKKTQSRKKKPAKDFKKNDTNRKDFNKKKLNQNKASKKTESKNKKEEFNDFPAYPTSNQYKNKEGILKKIISLFTKKKQ